MLALNSRCSDDATSRARACKLGWAGLTSKAEEGAMRWCLGAFATGSGIAGDIVVPRRGVGHGRVGVHGRGGIRG